jgi:hypothetical protein
MLGLAQLVNALNHEEDHQGDYEEIDDCLDQQAVVESGSVAADAPGHFEGREVNPAGKQRDEGGEQVIDDGIHDGGESSADHDADGEVDHIATIDEIAELSEPFWFSHMLSLHLEK